jgi:micrococcal nuclease
LIVTDLFGNNEEEIRFLGIDAPEIHRSRNLKLDERETHLPGRLLIQLGLQAKAFLNSLAPAGTSITLVMEKQHSYDDYGRTLAYVFLPDGSCLNEIMVKEGYTKSCSKYYCYSLAEFQVLTFAAKTQSKGLSQNLPFF